MHSFFKPAATALAAMGSAVIETATPMIVLTGAFVIADTVTAYRLQRRLAAAGKIERGAVGFSSARFGKVFVTMTKIIILLLLTSMADYLILGPLGIPAVKIVAGAVCFWQAISLLENEAAENDAPWAVHARKFLIDKARRYVEK